MDKNFEKLLMKLLAMGNLIDPLSRIQGELRFVNEFNFENEKIDIPDEEAVQGLMNELKIKDERFN